MSPEWHMQRPFRMTALDFAHGLAEPDAMDERRDVDTLGRRDSDRKPGAFSDPRFVLQIMALVISVTTGLLVSWMVSQTRTTALESAAANLNEKAARLEAQVAPLVSSVQANTVETRTLQAEVQARGREVQDLKEANRMHEARIITLERGLARVEARGN